VFEEYIRIESFLCVNFGNFEDKYIDL